MSATAKLANETLCSLRRSGHEINASRVKTLPTRATLKLTLDMTRHLCLGREDVSLAYSQVLNCHSIRNPLFSLGIFEVFRRIGQGIWWLFSDKSLTLNRFNKMFTQGKRKFSATSVTCWNWTLEATFDGELLSWDVPQLSVEAYYFWLRHFPPIVAFPFT